MEIGLYFGSFNPIHHGHLIIAMFVQQNTSLKEVWFVVTPQNPLKPSASLLNEHHRFFLVQEAIQGEPSLKVSNIEFHLPRPSYTVDTLAYLREQYPQHKFWVILGSDAYQNFQRWKNPEAILKNHEIIVYKRPGFEIKTQNSRITILEKAPLLQISSTHIRELIKQNKSIRYLVPQRVMNEIIQNRYYH